MFNKMKSITEERRYVEKSLLGIKGAKFRLGQIRQLSGWDEFNMSPYPCPDPIRCYGG